MVFVPQFEGDFPTLGFQVADWMTENLAQPDVGAAGYRPFIPTVEQVNFYRAFYRLDPITGERLVRRGVLSRPRGWGKSPGGGGQCIAEGLGPVCFGGWDANGQPVGVPWSYTKTPTVLLTAATERQVENAWKALLEMLVEDAPVHDNYDLEVLRTQVNLPVGEIVPVPLSSDAIKGARVVFTLMDQTEQWVKSNGGVKVAKIIYDNAAKRGTSVLETPNAYHPGEGSVAELTANAAEMVRQGKAKRTAGFLWDHREAPPETDLTDDGSLTWGLRVAYGDSSGHPDGCVIHDPACPPGWVSLENIKSRIWDPDMAEQDARAEFLNQVTHAVDSYVSRPQVLACAKAAPDGPIEAWQPIVLGFDGSRSRVKGNADATALIACRVSDGFTWPIGIWGPGPQEKEWTCPVELVKASVHHAMNTYTVVGCYADFHLWEEFWSGIEAQYGPRLTVKRSAGHPCKWIGNHTRAITDALTSLYSAISNGEWSYNGDATLTQHLLNARRQTRRSGFVLTKSFPQSADKIDAAYALMLAWAARLQAVSQGAHEISSTFTGVQRLY